MKSKHIPLGKILGIPIGLDYTWFLIFALLTWSLAVNYFPQEFKNWSVFHYWFSGAVTAIMLFISVLVHELGHALVAQSYKIKVKRISLFIFGGIAEIQGEPPKASAEFWIAIAGPITSFLLAGLFFILQQITMDFVWFNSVFKYLAYINFILALFNLIPGFPLDGGRVLRAIIWGFSKNYKRATSISSIIGRFIAFAFIFIGVMNIFSGRIGAGIWITFIGWFLENAANSQLQSQALHETLSGHKVTEAVTNDFAIIPHDTTIQEVVDNHILGIGRRSLLVKKDEKFIGLLTVHQLKNVSANKWPETNVTEVMIPDIQTENIDIDSPLWSALLKMDQDDVNQLPVTENGEIIGILTRANVLAFIRSLQ